MNIGQRAKADLWATLRGDWWYYAGAFYTFHQLSTLKICSEMIQDNGVTQTVTVIDDVGATEQPLGQITFDGAEHETHIYVAFAASAYAPRFWQHAIQKLKDMAAVTRQFRQEALGPTAEEVIEMYYRRRAKGMKVTLRQLAKEFDFNPNYLSNVRTAYKKAGKWGSKKP
jgi:hypothetical protein